MSDVTVKPRREWTEQDDINFAEFLRKEGYESFKLRVEKMICDATEELIAKQDIRFIPRIEILTTLLKICDNARA